MLEQFRKWNRRGDISITYKDEHGEKHNWTANQDELLSHILTVVRHYQQINIRLTNRGLYYKLVKANIIPNFIEVYKRLCTFFTDGRYAGIIDWEAIEDSGRVVERKAHWDNIASIVDSAIDQYRLPRWSDQDYYVELYCEKQAMENTLRPVADKYHIYFGFNKGYSSAATIYELANRLNEQIQDGKNTVVLYLGDHDASGLDMIRDIRERVVEFLTKGDNPVEEPVAFEILPLALTMEQIKQYGPPPNPAKQKDPRAKWYIKQFGNISWELDALDPEVLQAIAEQGILKYLDMEKYNKWIEREDKEKQALIDFSETLNDDEGEE